MSRRRRHSYPCSMLLLLVVVVACGGRETRSKEPKELDTVDIDARYDAELSTETDVKERRNQAAMAGRLPSDFPADLPIFTPSSVIDFGRTGEAGGYVELDTAVPIGEVRSSLGSRLQRAGWEVEAIGDTGTLYVRQGRRVRVALTDLQSGTRIRYDY